MAAGDESASFRLPSGGLVDRARGLTFKFDGRDFTGLPGDTLASALLANGVRLFGRSFKYHRRRGVFGAGAEEPNALVELRAGARREPNTRATTVELYDGCEAASQNRWPSLGFDLMAVNQLAGPMLSAGFYYKTFMWPAAFWERLYEPMIRRAAGLGRAAREADPDAYEKANAHCDVLVIGAGPAGLTAALVAARTGARVILADDDFVAGGRLNSERHIVAARLGSDWAADAAAELASMANVRIMLRTTIFGAYDQGTYGAVERVGDHHPIPPAGRARHRSWRIVARRCVLAAGAIERPIAFSGNDLPGIMLASAVRTYLNRFAVAPGQRAVVLTSGDDGLTTVADLIAAGVAVAAIVDTRGGQAQRGDIPTIGGGQVLRAIGRRELEGIEVEDGAGKTRAVACDLLAVANGWTPTLHLTCHLGGKPAWNEALETFLPGALPAGMSGAGAAAGQLTLAEAMADGAGRGAEAAAAAGRTTTPTSLPKVESDEGRPGRPVWRSGPCKKKAFVDLQNDVTVADLELAHREGYQAPEHAKRYTTLGMATDQGKTSGVVALGILAGLSRTPIQRIAATTFRPPYTPVSLGALAGHRRGKHFRPTRLTPSHAWAAENRAVLVESGLWLRAQYFVKAGETQWRQSVDREVTAVRSAVGVCDVSTLGKIEVQGRDAGKLLDLVYVNTFSTLGVGRARYGVMLREDGFVMDDGTATRLAEDRYFVTTTTANAERVVEHLEYCRQVLWPHLDVAITPATEQWAQFSVAGPKARELLQQVIEPATDISNAALPFMAAAPVRVLGAGGLLFRVSFSGELAYELAVPARHGDGAVRALMAAGADLGVTPYGIEALNVMRIEKGHAGGAEINGQTTARDLGLSRMMSSKKDFIGRVMAERQGLTTQDRAILVGIKPIDAGDTLTAGAHFIPSRLDAVAVNEQGYLSSVCHSPTLGSDIGLGFLRRGRDRIGERIRAVDLLRKTDVMCEVAYPVFVDVKGERLHG